MNLPYRFIYCGRWPFALCGAIVLGVLTVLTAQDALETSGFFALVHWLVLVLLGACSLFMLFSVLRRFLRSCPIIEFGQDEVVLPHGLLHRKTKRIPYSEIQAIDETTHNDYKVLILHAGQKFGRINAALLTNDDAYASIKSFLYERIKLTPK